MKKIILAVAALAVIASNQVVAAHAGQNFDIGGAFGAGVLLGPPSTGAGLMGSYWFTNNIGVSAIATAAYNDYSELGVQANYLFDSESWSETKIRPFVGVGFSIIDGPDGHGAGPYSYWNYDVEGKGVEIHAGIMHQATYLSEHLFFILGGIYHVFDIDVKHSISIDSEGWNAAYNYDADWTSFGVVAGIQYYF